MTEIGTNANRSDPSSANPPGIDRDRVTTWLIGRDPSFTPPLSFELAAGGRSNLTYRVEDATGREVVLRRPPLGETLSSAHDMSREYRILAALHGSSVPVPRPLGMCEDAQVSDATLYAMEFIEGFVLRRPEVAESLFSTLAERTLISDSVVSVLVDLHLLEPAAVQLGDLGRHGSYIKRQLKRWNRQWEETKTREVPLIEEAHARLTAGVPRQQRVSIVHGDYRLDNVVIGHDAAVAAVLDWELCTLGDPLADLGGLLVSWLEKGDDESHAVAGTASTAGGFASRAEIVAAYAERSRLDVSEIDYYIAFAYWKLACICEGVYARYRAGVMGDDDIDLDGMARRVIDLAELSTGTCP